MRSGITRLDGSCTSVEDGFSRLLVFALPASLAVRGRLSTIRQRRVFGIAIASLWPLVLNLVLDVAGAGGVRSLAGWGWLAAFCFGLLGVLVTGAEAWERLARHWPSICDLLRGAAQQDVDAWFRRWYSRVPQVACGVVPAALGVSVLASSWPTLQGHVEVNLISYLTVGWVSFFGGLFIYVLVLFSRVAFALERSGLAMDHWEPASTLGVKELSGAYVALLGLIALSTLAAEIAATRVPGFDRAVALRAFLIGCPVCGAALGILVGVFPQLAIYRMIRMAKLEVAGEIDREVGDTQAALKGDLTRVTALVDLRAKVMGTQGLPFRAPWLIPLVAGLLGPLAAFLLGHLAK